MAIWVFFGSEVVTQNHSVHSLKLSLFSQYCSSANHILCFDCIVNPNFPVIEKLFRLMIASPNMNDNR